MCINIPLFRCLQIECVSGPTPGVADSLPENNSFSVCDEKLRRMARNRRYRNSVKGLNAINRAKENYRAKFGSTLIKEANSAYKQTVEGSMKQREAENRYKKREKGRFRLKEALSRYQKGEKGRLKLREAMSRYQKNEKGRAALRRASLAYIKSNQGRDAVLAYRCRGEGRASNMKTEDTNRKTDAGREENKRTSSKEQKSQFNKRAYRKSKSFQFFKGQMDEFDFERHFDDWRGKASERIRCHYTSLKSKVAFGRCKKQILAARKSIYLPPLPRQGNYKNKSSLFRTRKFLKSRSRLHFKLAATMIIKKNMDESLVKDLGDLLFPNLSLKGRPLSFKKSFMSTQLVDRMLTVRDSWIRCLYAVTYRLAGVAESLLAQFGMDSTGASTGDKILGWRCHTKGSEPYFPRYSSKSGELYIFKAKSRKNDGESKGPGFHGCVEECTLATDEEVQRFMKLLESAASLDVRNSRRAIQKADFCVNELERQNSIYRLIVEKRNHPEACFQSKTACSSGLLLLRRLAVHYKGAREIYKMANMMKITDQFISDLDTAVTIGDIHYLLKLLAYKPFISPKTFDVERPDQIINHETMAELYGPKLEQFYQKFHSLPKDSCVCCLELIESDSITSHTITDRMKKPKDPNSQYRKLLKYLQSPEWVNTGNDYVGTLIGKKLCNYCYKKLQKNEVPRVSVMNNMNVGKAPQVINQLSQFERILIRQVAMYQTVCKLDTNAGNLPYNQRMSAVKGFAIHLPVPLQTTLQQLGDGRPGKLLDPRNFILLHGIPNKNRGVWQRLININNVYAALQWLVKHNPFYKDIVLPENPLDLLPPDPMENNADDDLEEFLCETLEEPVMADSSSIDMESIHSDSPTDLNGRDEEAKPDVTACDSSNESGLTEGDSDIVCLDNPEYLIAQKKDRDPTEGIDNAWEEYLCESSDPDQSYDSGSSIEGVAKIYAKDPTLGCGNEILQEFLCRSSLSQEGAKLSGSSLGDGKGGKSSSNHIPEELSFYDLGDMEEDPSFRSLWEEASKIKTAKIAITRENVLPDSSEESLQRRRKCVTAICLINYIKRILSNGLCCQPCGFSIKKTRQLMNLMIRDETLPFIDLECLSSVYVKMKECLKSVDKSLSLNVCWLCKERKLKSGVPVTIFKSRKRASKNKNKRKCKKGEMIDEGRRSIASIKTNTYDNLDELCQDGTLCNACYAKFDYSVPVKANFFYKSKTTNINSLKKQALLARTLNRRITTLKAVSDITRLKVGFSLEACIKCKNPFAEVHSKILSAPVETQRETLSNTDEVERHPYLRKSVDNDAKQFAACIDADTDELFVVETPTIKSSANKERLRVLAMNMTHIKHLVANIKTVRKRKLHCEDCLHSIKQTKQIFKKILAGKFLEKFPRLENLDSETLFALCLDSEKRLFDSSTLGQCYQCQKNNGKFSNLMRTKGGASDHILDDFDDIDDDDEESILQDEAMSAEDSKKHDDIADDGPEESHETKTRKLLEHMSEEDFKNLVEQYTVTGLENMKENPDLLDDLYQLLRLDEDPLDLDDSNLDMLAFPEIFCWGIGGKKGFRPEKGTNVQYERTRMFSSNPVSRRHIQYLFHLAGENERRKITRSIFSTIKFVQGLGSVDSKTLLQMIKNKDPKLLRRMTRVLKDVPNTASYWNSQHAKLQAQIGKYGPPTFFATFSPAEYDWPELIEYLREANSDLPNIDEISASDLIAKDPVLTTTFVHKRFNALLDFILSAKPLGEVTSYFIRHEYQSRGTVHFHTLLWIKDAPIMGKSSDEEIASFIQKHVSCKLPDQLQEPTLYDNVTRYQTHSCRSYCLRRFKNRKFKHAKKETACRFGFPRPKSKRFALHDVLSSVIARRSKRMRKRLYDLPRAEEERFINDYNPTLSFLWRGNMDIQFIAENSYAICNYITKYVTKSETSNIDFLDFKDLSKSTFQNLSKFAYACLKSREMGAHEAADRLLQNHGQMWRSSETFVWVQAAPSNMRSRVMKNIKDLEGQKPDNNEVFYPDVLHDFYPNRPRTPTFNDMSLYDFVARYDKVSGPPKEGDRYIRIAKEDGTYLRTMRARTKTPVVYHNEYSAEKQPEMFYYSMLCLFKPWRNEADIMGSSESCEEEFFCVVDQYPQLKEMAGKKINIQKAREDMFKAADKNIHEKDDAIDSNDSACYEYDTADADTVLDQGMEDYDAVNSSSEIQTQQELENFVATLNEDQMRVYNRVTQHIEHMFDHDGDMCPNETCKMEPLLLYVSGYGGTGKSYLIKAIQGFMYVQSSVYREKAGLILAAPTGLAAANINGQTIHSVLKLPVEHGSTPKYTELRKRDLDQMRNVMGNLKAVIIDEISMVSNVMLMYVNLRLQEVFGDSSFFGGKCLIVFGDLLQLPPVKGQPVFEEVSAKVLQTLTGGLSMSLNLWLNFEFDELRINQRQAGPENSTWSGILSRIRIGTQTPTDIEMIGSRVMNVPILKDPSPKQYLSMIIKEYEKIEKRDSSIVCLMPTVTMVNEFNDAMMSKRFPNARSVPAIDTIDGRTKRIQQSAERAVRKLDKLQDPRNTAGLEKTLHLCEGMKIMLRRNVDVAKGLVNGSVGIISKIHVSPSGVVDRISVIFDGLDGDLELLKDRRKIEIFPDAFLHRQQFPISVAYAITIHKSQGLSLTTVMADLGKTVFECGQVYVALSRCKALLGLHLINFAPQKITVNLKALAEYKRLGSKPVKDGECFGKPKPIKGKRVKVHEEKVWYTSKNAKKAQSTINDYFKASKDEKEHHPANRKSSKTKSETATTKSKEPKSKIKTNGTGNSRSNEDHIQNIRNENHDTRIYCEDVISSNELMNLYNRVLIPWSLGAFPGGSNLWQWAQELNPDAFNNVSNIEDKWLSTSTLLHLVSELQDEQLVSADDRVSIYNLGPFPRTCFLREQRSRTTSRRRGGATTLGYIDAYVNFTYSEERFTRHL